VFSNAVRDVVEGKAEPQAALDEAQAKAEEIFNSPGAGNPQP
jgi:ABC-type glycerol-3-phosphate transport system substrate-binding protein